MGWIAADAFGLRSPNWEGTPILGCTNCFGLGLAVGLAPGLIGYGFHSKNMNISS